MLWGKMKGGRGSRGWPGKEGLTRQVSVSGRVLQAEEQHKQRPEVDPLGVFGNSWSPEAEAGGSWWGHAGARSHGAFWATPK